VKKGHVSISLPGGRTPLKPSLALQDSGANPHLTEAKPEPSSAGVSYPGAHTPQPTPLTVGGQKTAWRVKGSLALTLTSASGVPTFLPIEDALLVEAYENLFDCLLGTAVLSLVGGGALAFPEPHLQHKQQFGDWVSGCVPPTPAHLPIIRKTRPENMPFINQSGMAVHMGVSFMQSA
jgi:hypothetical protein